MVLQPSRIGASTLNFGHGQTRGHRASTDVRFLIAVDFTAGNVRVGSKPEVSDGHENVGFRGQSGSRFRATGCLLVAKALNRSAIVCWDRRFELLAATTSEFLLTNLRTDS